MNHLPGYYYLIHLIELLQLKEQINVLLKLNISDLVRKSAFLNDRLRTKPEEIIPLVKLVITSMKYRQMIYISFIRNFK